MQRWAEIIAQSWHEKHKERMDGWDRVKWKLHVEVAVSLPCRCFYSSRLQRLALNTFSFSAAGYLLMQPKCSAAGFNSSTPWVQRASPDSLWNRNWKLFLQLRVKLPETHFKRISLNNNEKKHWGLCFCFFPLTLYVSQVHHLPQNRGGEEYSGSSVAGF